MDIIGLILIKCGSFAWCWSLKWWFYSYISPSASKAERFKGFNSSNEAINVQTAEITLPRTHQGAKVTSFFYPDEHCWAELVSCLHFKINSHLFRFSDGNVIGVLDLISLWRRTFQCYRRPQDWSKHVREWPSQSPGLNPAQSLWQDVDGRS